MPKTQIVSRNMRDDHVLGRLARILSKYTGWPLNERPQKSFELTYFICYIEQAEKYSDWSGATAALFTHFEKGTPYKEFWWDLAARTVGMRMAMAGQYVPALLRYGKTTLARVPVEREIFWTREVHPGHKVPIVGVSGIVDRGSPRKGERVLASVVGGALRDEVNFCGTGKGWPVQTAWRDYAAMGDYYRNLDFYLCTAIIEGGPMPVLEALSCGVPVIIPRGVGLLDDIPDTAGISRYAAGSAEDMERAIREAINSKTSSPATLAETVSAYTPENWAADHKETFAQWLGNGGGNDTSRVERADHGKSGVYYVAFGEPARKCAKAAMQSFGKYLSDVPIALCASSPIGTEDVFVEYNEQEMDIGGRTGKLRIYDLAPGDWQYVLYLDADTEVTSSAIRFYFDLLRDGWDMVICKNPAKYHVARRMVRPDNGEECRKTFMQLGTDELIQLNGGAFAFQRNHRTKEFFASWYEEWLNYGKRDQAALLRALWKHPLKMFVLGNEWNTITRYASPESSAGLLHYPMAARRWRGQLPARLDSDESWAIVSEWERKNAGK